MTRSSPDPLKKPQARAAGKRSSARKRTARLSAAAVETLYARLSAERPDPRTELEFHDPFTLLVAVVLSAQATDKGVNLATRGLFAAAPTPAAMAALGEAGIAAHIRTIGLWRNKAKHVLALSETLLRAHGGETPRSREALEALPGVGRKTANVVLSEAFGEATLAVDTHVFRVASRTGLAAGATPEAVETQLLAVTPPVYLRGAHHWLILHGRYVCVARKPKCPQCVLADLCLFAEKTSDQPKAARSARQSASAAGST